jgi:hypothetical protein
MIKKSAVSLIVFFTISLMFTARGTYADEIPFKDTLFRCGSDIVSLGYTKHKIKDECGEPDSEQSVGEKSTLKYRKGKLIKGKRKSNTNLTEWTYKRDFGIYVLTFEGSRLVKKEYFRE